MAPKKKAQQEKMSLGNFLSDQNYGSWAEEMEEMPLPSRSDTRPSFGGGGGDRRDFSSYSRQERPFEGSTLTRPPPSIVYTLIREDRGPPREALPLPTRPPFTAHLGNLSFDVTVGDVEDYFAGCEVTSVRIVEDKLDRKPKGFGYVEFGSVEGLKKALELSGTQFQGRNIRVSVAEPSKEREGGRELNDWSRKGPLPDLPANTRRPSGRGFDTASDAGSDRGARRGQAFEGDGKTRDFGNWERKGPLSPALPPPGPAAGDLGSIRRNDRSFDRRASPSWGEGRPDAAPQDGSRPPRREFQERPPVDRTPTAAEADSQWRARMKPDAPSQTPTPDASMPSSPSANPAVPASRPKLNLAKRTVSEAPQGDPTSAVTPSSASPFGAARPIDTAARDREIADKREQALKKKEEEDREREAKAKEAKAEREKVAGERAAEKLARGEKEPPSGPRENGRTASTSTKDQGTPKENGAAAPRPTFEILRRMTDQEDANGEAETEDGGPKESANGDIIGDKETKPQEITRNIDDANGEGSAEGIEGDGFSVVPGRKKKGRAGNNAGSRALAS